MEKKSRPRKQNHKDRPEPEYDQKMVDLARVTRVMAGGKRMSFRASIVIGDRKGRVGYGVAKGVDVQVAMTKALRQAEKSWIKVPITEEGSIPHIVNTKFKSAHVMVKPAPAGTGVKAGGALRVVLELAGVQNVVAKQLGASNKINNIKAAYKALSMLRNVSGKKNK